MCNAPLDWVAEKMRSQGAEIAALRAEVERLLNALRNLHDFAEPTHIAKYSELSADAFAAAADLLRELEPPAAGAEHLGHSNIATFRAFYDANLIAQTRPTPPTLL